MRASGLTEVACRGKCVELQPSCAGYAFTEHGGLCEVYKRENLSTQVNGSTGEADVLCYAQDNDAFDTSANVLQRFVTVTDPDGVQVHTKTEVVCRDKPKPRQRRPSSHPAPAAVSGWPSWSASLKRVTGGILEGAGWSSSSASRKPAAPWTTSSWLASLKRVTVALTGGGYHVET
eukprot:gnl/TRDRNA2_/TRDRNA2_144506_c1_seq1.p1 gnl/TRDRNA2_/TRDRNA2_144506_c1~~gnl/TRDRNA2_/TRDRNA2_144506_c1_seq1.p1  ORF type:complete len:201 (-),score=31.44 gnl/TRDRNA2_/TRDRNA2_144506_c1_seq1:157-684(-)